MRTTIRIADGGIRDIPRHPHGRQWLLAMLHDDQVSFADSTASALGALIDGYDTLPPTPAGRSQARRARYGYAAQVAARAQERINDQAIASRELDPSMEDADVLVALLGNRVAPLEGANGETSVNWTHRVPVVLIATDFVPFTNHIRPTGHVLLVDPSDEIALLESLSELGVVHLRCRAPG
ncbi:hypothetical protein [Phytoactinopolyspora mesophila]|uniref:Uncharacterized protein n=1 Tax=Phytoactinopolyspora mesophila TaxID=2650750 RepID=A0A7K3MB97_9ACTN|nr:hypothetical protein [Phytoactinopolyspora mesophila]NDL60242.1 hypothetical protein [Phytoactinopolyspora mesophila]